MPRYLDWNEIAVGDTYRNADELTQGQIRMYWLKKVAPILHPDYMADPRGRMAVMQNVWNFNPPPKLPDEDNIVKPDTLNQNNFSMIEDNPAFQRKTYAEQQQLKNLWYMKTSVVDEQLKGATFEEQKSFYENLMRRGPAMASGLLPKWNTDDLRKDFDAKNRAAQATQTFVTNMFASAASATLGLIAGPARLIRGEESFIANVMLDIEKDREWVNALSQSNNFLTKTLPSLVGYGIGMAVGPWGKISGALVGTEGIAAMKGAEGISKLLTRVPGLVERAGVALGAKIPSIAYATAADTILQGLQGVSENIALKRPWSQGLAGNLALGAGIGVLTRYVGMYRTIRRAAAEFGLDPKTATGGLASPFEIGSGKKIPDNFRKALEQHPLYGPVVSDTNLVDQNGILFRNKYNMGWVEMESNVLGINMEQTADRVVFKDNKTGTVLHEILSPDSDVRIQKSLDFLDGVPDPDSMKRAMGKELTERIMTRGQVFEAKLLNVVPESARLKVVEYFKKNNIKGFDYTRSATREGVERVDAVFQIIRRNKNDVGAAQKLAALGVDLQKDGVAQLRMELEKVYPSTPYLIFDKKMQKFVPATEVPRYVLKADEMTDGISVNRVITGDGTYIRDQLERLRKSNVKLESQMKKYAKSMHMSYEKWFDTNVVEISIPMTTPKGGPFTVKLHVPDVPSTIELLSTGRTRGLKEMAGHFFGDNKELMEIYEGFAKDMKKIDPQWAKNEWVPFLFSAGLARQNDYFLGVSKGRYLLQPLEAKGKIISFDDLKSVVNYLDKKDIRALQPDLDGGLSVAAVKANIPAGLKDPFSQYKPVGPKMTKKYDIMTNVMTQLSPTWAVIERLGKLEVTQEMIKKGVTPQYIYNALQDMTGMLNSFTNVRLGWLKNLRTGYKDFNPAKGKLVTQWMESFETEAEAAAAGFDDTITHYIRSDVEGEMTARFGSSEMQKMASLGTQLTKYYADLFGLSREDWRKMVKHYFPHVRDDVIKAKSGLSEHWADKAFAKIPSADRKYFMEFLREVDARDMVYETDPFRITEMYTHLMGRKLFTRPILKQMGEHVKSVMDVWHASGKEVPGDYKAMMNYIGGLFSSIEGIASPPEKAFQYAIDNTLNSLAEQIDAKFGTEYVARMKGKYNPLSTLVTATSASYLAARPYPIFRNLAQSLITGGSVIGDRWWMEGVDRAMKPGSLTRGAQMGLTMEKGIPLTSGTDLSQNWFGRLVSKVMKPYKWSDDFNRVVVYNGMEARIESALKDLELHKITMKEFQTVSGANLFGLAEMDDAMQMLVKGDIPGFTHRLARLASDRTQFLYEQFNQPQMFRSAVGRFLGQYTSWPTNFMNLTVNRLTNDALTLKQKIGYFARLGASTGAIAFGLASAGLNVRQWAPWNMMMLQGGPYYQLIDDMMGFINGDTNALTSLSRTLAGLVPFSLEGQGVLRAVEAIKDGNMHEALLHLMSAPINYDIYPRRSTATDDIAKAIQSAGQKYIDAMGFVRKNKAGF